MSYLHALDHIVTVSVTTMMFLIGTQRFITHWSNLTKSWRYYLYQVRSIFDTHIYPILNNWDILKRK